MKDLSKLKHWERIKLVRTDISEYILHCTRERYVNNNPNLGAFDVLKKILEDGFLRATFAVKDSWLSRTSKPTVRGPFAAVCFTEQPLQFFIQSIGANRRYTEFAVAVRKDELFNYGGRPVIYSDEKILGKQITSEEKIELGYPVKSLVYNDGLPLDLQYLWVGYDPTAIWDSNRQGYAIDWTHEREWRARPNKTINNDIGLSSNSHQEKVVPIHLPHQDQQTFQQPHFVILVDTETHKEDLIVWIQENFGKMYKKGEYYRDYAFALLRAGNQILSFEKIRASKQTLGRVEDFIQAEENN